jgi:hypothetical protein
LFCVIDVEAKLYVKSKYEAARGGWCKYHITTSHEMAGYNWLNSFMHAPCSSTIIAK